MISISKEETVRMTQLDEQTFDGRAQMIKALIPYMGSSAGAGLAMIARFIEFRNTMDLFNNPKTLSACGIGEPKPMEPKELLRDIRKYVGGPEAENIDRMLSMLNMSQFYEKFRDMDFQNPQNMPDLANLMAQMQAMNTPEGSTHSDDSTHGYGRGGSDQRQGNGPRSRYSHSNADHGPSKSGPERSYSHTGSDQRYSADDTGHGYSYGDAEYGHPHNGPEPAYDHHGPELHGDMFDESEDAAETFGGNEQLINSLKSMLSPEQQQMFEALSTMNRPK